MYVIVAEFRIHAGQAEAFGRVIDQQARDSVRLEPGCHQFDVCQDESDPHRFLLYEIYTDRAAFETHRELPHTKQFFAQSTPLIAERVVRGLFRRPAQA